MFSLLFYYDYGLVGIGFYFVGVDVSPHLQEIELPAFKMSTHHCCSPSVLLTTVSAGCHSFCVKRDCYRKKLTLCFFSAAAQPTSTLHPRQYSPFLLSLAYAWQLWSAHLTCLTSSRHHCIPRIPTLSEPSRLTRTSHLPCCFDYSSSGLYGLSH